MSDHPLEAAAATSFACRIARNCPQVPSYSGFDRRGEENRGPYSYDVPFADLHCLRRRMQIGAPARSMVDFDAETIAWPLAGIECGLVSELACAALRDSDGEAG
jgi:hypothetical protein